MKNTKKLFAAAIMMLIAFAAVVSSTYAWFTLSNPLVVEDIDISIGQSEGIYMSVDNATWKTSLTAAEIQAGTNSHFAQTYMPVCATVSDGKLDLTQMKKLSSIGVGTGAVDAAASATQGVSANNHYTTFTLYLKADVETTLDVSSIVAGAYVATSSTEKVGDTNTSEEQARVMAATSMLRVAVTDTTKGTKIWRKYADEVSGIEVTSDATMSYNDGEDKTLTCPSFYSDTNKTYRTFVRSGILNAASDNGISGNALISGSTSMYKYAKIGLDGFTDYKAAHDGMCTSGASYQQEFVTVPTTGTSVTFTVWLEGWDSLCIDDLSNVKLYFNFILLPHVGA